MAFTLTLYKSPWAVNKIHKTNLTLYKTVTGNIPPADVRTEIPLSSPSFIIQNIGEPNCNYAYVAEFSRYYFVNTPIHVGGDLWRLNMEEDLLMTHASAIDTLTPFISRYENSDTYDSYVDPLEIPKFGSYHRLSLTSQGGWKGNQSYANDSEIRYAVFFSTMPEEISTDAGGSSITNRTPKIPVLICTQTGVCNLVKAGVNFLALNLRSLTTYVSKILAYPYPFSVSTSEQVLKVKFSNTDIFDIYGINGTADRNTGVYIPNDTNFFVNKSFNFVTTTFTNHIPADKRFRSPTYLYAEAVFYPWGRISLNSQALENADRIEFNITSAGFMGIAKLTIVYYNDQTIVGEQNVGNADVTISMPYSGENVINYQSILGAAGSIGTMAAGIATENPALVMGGASGLIANGLNAETPGSVVAGGYGSISTSPVLHFWIKDHTNISSHLMGRIYNQSLTISQIADNAFFQCGSVLVPSVNLSYEDAKKIENLLKAGVYK